MKESKLIIKKNRIEWIDIAKGIGMVLVEIGHTYFPRSICLWLCSFHMPLFFLLSGMTYGERKNNFKEYVIRKFRTIMIPYYLFNIISIFVSYTFSYLKGEYVALTGMIKGVLLNWGERPFWFLFCLFVTEIIYFFVEKYLIKGKKNRVIIAVTLLILIAWLNNELCFAKWLPLCLDIIPNSMLFIMLGKYITKKRWEQLCTERILPVMFLVNMISFVINARLFDVTVSMFTNEYGFYPLALIGAISGSCFAFGLAKIICKTGNSLKKWLLFIGYNSAVYYGFHSIINPFVDRVLARILPYYNINTMCKIVTSIIIFVVTFLVIGGVVVPVYNRVTKKIISR